MYPERVEIRAPKGTKKRFVQLSKKTGQLVSVLKREALSDLFNKYEHQTTNR